MAVGTGFGFDLSQLDAELKRADEALKTLGKTGKTAARQLDEAFALAKNGNIQDFISVIDRLSNSLGKKGYNHAANMVREIATETTGAIDSVNRFATLMQTISDGGRSNVKNGAIESLKYQLDEALSRLGVLNEQLQFFTKGEGAKAVGANVVDTSALQQEANQLRVVVELLQRRLEHEQALAALKQRSGAIENQQALNTSWQKMEEERTKQLQQQSINAKEANKAYEQAYNDRYQMYAVMYDKMWQEDLKHFERQNSNAKSGSQQYAKDYEDRQRYYERWINEQFLREQENNKKIEEAKLAEEKRINQQISQDRIDQLGKESRERLKIEQMIRDTQRRNHEAREKELNDLFREQERQAKAQAKYDSKARQEKYKSYTTSYEGAIRTSNKANTLAKEIQAVKNLEAARAKLNKTDADYQKKLDDINARILQHNKNIAQATAGAKDLQKAHSKLGTTIASVFSIQAIRGYINQMIKVRGEMELQQRSLQAILQNKDAANEVWQKTIDFAVRSPFRIKDLVTYTKQLAAYRVESEKLYDTNKMLADVSAGLGVDMQRLILAFGQVKSANFLRGTELRQFTEAGIPMLDELAKLYTQMEGALVTSGDVFERISKRMVLFEDVEEVFKRMTAAGGAFYRMQEIQSETLKGQISNLKDSVDIMLNSMGKGMDGVLKKSVKSVKFLVDNYEVLIPILKDIIVALALYKVNSFAASEATLRMARSMKMAKISATGLGGAWTSLRVGLAQFGKDLGKTTKMLVSNPWLLLAAAIVTAAIKLNQFRKELKEVDKKYSQLLDKQGDVYLAFRQAGQKGNLEEQVAERRKQLQALVDMAKNEYGLVIDINVGEIDENKLEEEFNKIRQKMIEANAFSASFMKQMMKTNEISRWVGEGTFGLEESMFEDIEDLGDSYNNLYQELISNTGRTTEIIRDKWAKMTDEQRKTITDAQKKAVEDLEKPIQINENMVDYINRIKEAYEELLNSGEIKNNKISRFIKSFNRDTAEAKEEFALFAAQFRKEVEHIKDEKKKVEFLDISIGAIAKKKEWSEFEENYIRRLAEQEFGITFVPKTATPEELKNWQKSYNALFKGDSGFREITATATSQSQVIERLNGTYKSLEETIKRIEAAGKDSVLAGGAYEGQDLNKLKSDLAEVKRQLDWFGVEDKRGGGKDEVLEKLKNRINLIKEMNKEYEKLNKTFSKAESLAKVQKAYADTAKELGLDTSTMDFTDEGTIKSLEALLGKPEYAANKYVIELQKALDNFKVELGVEVKQEKDKDLKAQVQELFDQYDLSLELKKLNIPSDLAKSLFDVDYLDLDGLKKAVQDKKAKFIGTDMEDEYEKFLEKIDEMEQKAQEERLKTYVEYARKAIGERAKIKLEELRKLKEIEETFEEKEGDSEETRQYKRNMAKDATAQVKKEADQELKRLDWQEFEKSDMFVNLFKDLEGASDSLLNHAINKLQMFKEEWKDMPLEDVRQIVEKMNELEDALINIQPIQQMKEAKKKVDEAIAEAQMDTSHYFESSDAREKFGDGKNKKAFMQAVQEESVYQEQQKTDAQEQITYIETALRLLEGKATANDKLLQDEEEIQAYMKLGEQALRGQLTRQKSIVTNADKILARNEDIVDANQDYNKGLNKVADYMDDAIGMANDLYEAFKSLSVALGADEDSPAMIFADMGMSIMSSLPQMLSLIALIHTATQAAAGLGAAMNMAMGIVGLIVMAIQLVVQAINAIVSSADKKVDAQVEKLIDQADELNEKYNKLADTIDEIYNTQALEETGRQLDELYEKEKKAIEAAIAARRSDKNISDEEEQEIKDLEKRLVEMEESHMDTMREIASHATDGILDSVHDAAKEFTDAWYEAYAETGDGLKGLEENFEEMFLNLAKNQAAMQITNTFVKKWQDSLAKYVNEKDTELTTEDAAAWAQEVKDTFPELNEALEGFLGVIHEGLGTQGGGLSGLQKGIQGITEDQADILAAYWNSVRGYTASIDSKMDMILANMNLSAEDNPMLAQLRSQTDYLKRIKEVLDGATRQSSAIWVKLADQK